MNHGQTSQVTRRKFLTSASIGAGALWLAPPVLFAKNGNPVTASRNEGAAAKIIVQRLRDGVSVLSGSGGNIAVLSGADGKILVDAGLTTSRRGIAEALGGLDANPVRHLINTHWHYDHTDGNEWLNSAGARIIAQENTRSHLSTATRVEAWNFTFLPSPAGALPTEVFQRTLLCISTARRSHLNIMGRPIPTRTYLLNSQRRKSSTLAIHGGMATSLSSTIRPEELLAE